jgi:hypothetical protein
MFRFIDLFGKLLKSFYGHGSVCQICNITIRSAQKNSGSWLNSSSTQARVNMAQFNLTLDNLARADLAR